MKTFTMSDDEVVRANDWFKAQMEKTKAQGRNKDATGFRFAYMFYPTSLGPGVKVYDFHTKEMHDVSDPL